MPFPAAYFDDMYRVDDDPWGYRHRWYERRKQQLTLAVLPRERYRHGYEPACANGELAALLATRCDVLLASDLSGKAVRAARERCAALPNVGIEQRVLPHEWPDAQFDLIVIGELAYYLDADETAALAGRACASLAADGTLLACHWRHGFADGLQSAVAAHAAFDRCTSLVKLVHHEERDLLLDVWSKDARSVAEHEGLA
ncbi:MAG TPA: SAM-dependent methyltransferase [Paraburkholderia sp.]|jgi:SAM-dependent methyltransferase|nr:SAM-dependent methyltransferase [Paraburkholderia sp.]